MNNAERPFAEIRKNLEGVLAIVSLHRWAFFVPFCLVTSGAFILSLYYPRTYKATTSFERRNDPIMVNLPNPTGAASFEYFRSTMVRDLVSVDYMTEVVDNLGLSKDFEREQDGTLTNASKREVATLARSLASTLSVSTQSPNEHLDIVTITYEGPDQHIGPRLLDEAKRTYIRRTIVWIKDFLESQRDYFLNELEDASDSLNLAQRDVTKLRLETPFIDPHNPGGIATQLSTYEIQREELLSRRREYQAELSAQEQLLASIDPQAVTNPAGQGIAAAQEVYQSPATLRLIADIRKIDDEIEQLTTTRGMTFEHPSVKQLLSSRQSVLAGLDQQRIRDRQALVDGSAASDAAIASTMEVAPVMPWQREQARLKVQIEAQRSKIQEIDIRLASNEQYLEKLTRAKEGVYEQQEEYNTVMAAFQKAKYRHDEVTNTLKRIEPAIKVIEQGRLVQFSPGSPARGAAVPVNPQAHTILVLAILAGLGAGVVFVILAEIFDHVFHSSGHVAHSLGLPILDAIDEIVTSADRRRLLIRRTVVAPALVTCFLGLTAVTGTLAYLSVQQPWAYQRIKGIPQAAVKFLADSGDDQCGQADSGANVS